MKERMKQWNGWIAFCENIKKETMRLPKNRSFSPEFFFVFNWNPKSNMERMEIFEEKIASFLLRVAKNEKVEEC